jgi:hypothetical protein
MIKISKAVVFVRKNKLLTNWSYPQIAHGILSAIHSCSLTYTTDTDGNLNGIAWGEWKDNGQEFHCICAAGKGQLKSLLSYLKEVFPQCRRVTATRHGHFKVYNL